MAMKVLQGLKILSSELVGSISCHSSEKDASLKGTSLQGGGDLGAAGMEGDVPFGRADAQG